MKVIEVKSISKQYQLGAIAKDSIVDTVKSVLKKEKTSKESFMALQDISFDVKQGEVLGIIGKNGAGKSTLLKVLSRITEPTTGEIRMRGRVASLLEVGTGFHPELSGRENIFLNGAILGMHRKEIRTKFDEIVAFAGVEKFIDTPVKHYSSGMYVRLAFSVAAHLEPEILIIDEVLAVGDAEFQKKCLGKMKAVAGEGRTVLFVSHNMAAVESLCTKGLLLENGEMKKMGEPQEVIASYYKRDDNGKASFYSRDSAHGKQQKIYIQEISASADTKEDKPLFSGSDCHFKVTVVTEEEASITVRLAIYNQNNELLFICNNYQANGEFRLKPGQHQLICTIRDLPLYEGTYRIDALCLNNRIIVDSLENALSVDVGEADFFKTGRVSRRKLGLLLQRNNWELNK